MVIDLALSPAQRASVEKETAAIRERAKTATFPHKFAAAEWTHPNGHPRCKNCGQEERIGGMCVKPSSPTTAGPSTSIPMTADRPRPVDLTFTEALHPRGKTGTPQGGKFVAKNGGKGGGEKNVGATYHGQVRDFQRRTGLSVTGTMDAATTAKIRKLRSPSTGGGGSSKAKAKTAAAAMAARHTAAASAVNGLSPAQREQFRILRPKAPPGYHWDHNNRLVRSTRQTRRIRKILGLGK
jgi:hypothetical protein